MDFGFAKVKALAQPADHKQRSMYLA